MKTWNKFRRHNIVLTALLMLTVSAQAQTTSQGSAGLIQQIASSNSVAVPHLVRFGGVIKDSTGRPITGTAGVTFSLYREQEGGAPLWLETQNVALDNNGHYTVSLGATKADGLPVELFTSGEARWLGVQVAGQTEQPRVLLLSVPYALKAADAETVGGLPPSAFVLATSPVNTGASVAAASSSAASTAPPPASVTGSGTLNFIPLWTSSSNLGNSALFQSSGKVGIGTTTPGATLDVKGSGTVEGLFTLPATGTATATAGKSSQASDLVSSSFNSSTSVAVNQTFQWKAEAANNNTATPSGTLNLLFGSGTTTPSETGLKLSNKGIFTFATGQTFPGAGTITGVTAGPGLTGGGTTGSVTLGLLKTCSTNQVLQWSGTTWACATVGGIGTITGVTAGTDLTGGGTSGKVTLNLNTAALQTANDARYAQLGAANTYSQAQLVKGTTSALTAFASDPTGIGVLGYATTNGAGTGVGVEGLSATTNGVGVLGSGDGSQGVGVQGSGFVGVSGASAASGGIGVQGTTSGSNGTAVLGKDNGGSGTGVAGVGNTGVFGRSNTGIGVWGQGTPSGTGVFGQSSTGAAVWGQSSSGNGVYGQTSGTSGLVGGKAAVLGDSQNFFGVWGASSVTDGVHGTCTGNCAGVGGDNKQGGYGLFGYAATGDNTKPGTGVYGETFGTGSVRPGFGSDGVDGVAHNNNSGVAGINDGSGPGVYGSNKSATGGTGVFGTSTNGFGFQTDSNVSQARGGGGWVKAMAFVDPFASGGIAITRCYNSQQTGGAVSTPPCGISTVSHSLGYNVLDFGFQVSDRFLAVSSSQFGYIDIAVPDTNGNQNQVDVETLDANSNLSDAQFFIFVY